MFWNYSIIFLLIGFVCANIQSGPQDELAGLADKIPAEFADKIPAEFADKIPADVPTVEDAQKLFKEKCKKLTKDDSAYEHAVAAKEKLESCVKNQVNVTELQEEIENAKPTGDLDIVFGKYCKKTPTVLQCVKDFLTSVDPCLEEKEKANKKIALNITESLSNFLCYKDGDRIAMFIAEGGVECLQEKQDAIQNCANETIGKRLPTDMPSVDSLPLFIIEKEQCDDLSALQSCVVAELETCSEPTPANIIDALFKFVKKVTPCGKLESKIAAKIDKSEPSSANFILSSSYFVLATFLIRYL